MDLPAPLTLGAAPDAARAACVLVHGRGQAPEDFAGLISALGAFPVRFVLPRAAGGSWYAARAVDPLTAATRTALQAALDQLAATLAEARAGMPGRPVLLAGFSQGACLALELLFREGPVAAAALAFTGCRVGTATDDRPAADLAGLPVLLTGSDADPWIPVGAWAEAAAALGRSRARLRADLFPGRPHTIGPAELAILRQALSELASGRPVSLEAG